MELLVKSMVLVACAIAAKALCAGLCRYFSECPYRRRRRKNRRMTDFTCGCVNVHRAPDRAWAAILDGCEVVFLPTREGAPEYSIRHLVIDESAGHGQYALNVPAARAAAGKGAA